MAGHSKFANIKHRKAAQDKKRGKIFTKLIKEITVAARSGGGDIDTNPRLRSAVAAAKAENMPKDNIERAIKRASDKSQGDYKEVIFEGYAPHGIAILVETATDNNTRTVANVRSYFNKCDGSLGTSGSVVFMFDHTCNFKIKGEDLDLEELELELIDYGVEEIFEDTDEDEDGNEIQSIMIYAPFESFGKIQAYLEENNIEILSSGFERIPQVTKKINAEQMADVEKLLEKIEEDDDVQNVYHTMEESSDD